MPLRVCGQPHALRVPLRQAKFACECVECQSDEARQMLNLIQSGVEVGMLVSWFEVCLVAGNGSNLEYGFRIANKK